VVTQNQLPVHIEFVCNGIFYSNLICFLQIFPAYSAVDQDEQLKNYIHSRTHCLDNFEAYINTLKRQHGIIRNAASDLPTFDPGISVNHL
jgi:hypothetical protein